MSNFTFDRDKTERASRLLGPNDVVCDGPGVAAIRAHVVKLEEQLALKVSRQKQAVESAMTKLQNMSILMRSDVAGLEKPSLAISGSFEKYQSDYLKWLSFRDCLISQVELREEVARKKVAPLREKMGDLRKKVSEAKRVSPLPPSGFVVAKAVQAKADHKKALKRAKNERRKLRKLQSRAKIATVKTKTFVAEVKMLVAEKKLKAVTPARSFADAVRGKADVIQVPVTPKVTLPESSKKLPIPPAKVFQEVKTGKKKTKT